MCAFFLPSSCVNCIKSFPTNSFSVAEFALRVYNDPGEQNPDGSVNAPRYPQGYLQAVHFHPSNYQVRPVAWLPPVSISAQTLMDVWRDSLKSFRQMKENYRRSGQNGSLPLYNFVPTHRPDLYWVRNFCFHVWAQLNLIEFLFSRFVSVVSSGA